MPLKDGDEFADYVIERFLGSGAMGEVYLAQHPRLRRFDALKVLTPSLTNDEEFRRRFSREADLAASLWHPNIVGIHDRGEFDGQLWISMDYVDGKDACQLLKDNYPAGMPVGDVVEVISAVAEALDFAHERHLLHRDVKPANILMTRMNSGRRRILLADFGIARQADEVGGLTGTNLTIGTVGYVAPEQLMGEQIDGRADQYGLAATTFHLLTGKMPFHHSNPFVAISKQLATTAPQLSEHRPSLAPLDGVLSTALAKDPNERYHRCADFAEALRIRSGRPEATAVHPAADPSTASPTPEPPRQPTRALNVPRSPGVSATPEPPRQPTRAMNVAPSPPTPKSEPPRQPTKAMKIRPPATPANADVTSGLDTRRSAARTPDQPADVTTRLTEVSSSAPRASDPPSDATTRLTRAPDAAEQPESSAPNTTSHPRTRRTTWALAATVFALAAVVGAGFVYWTLRLGNEHSSNGSATLTPNAQGAVPIRSVAGDTVCLIVNDGVICEAHFTCARNQAACPNEVAVDAHGRLEWKVGDMGTPSQAVRLEARTYHALGWTIVADGTNTQFRNDSTGRGMIVNPHRVDLL